MASSVTRNNDCKSEQEIFMRAMELESPERRDAYLAEACGDDSPLRQRVEALLAARERDDSLLDRPPAFLPTVAASGQPIEGEHIGPYKLREKIGEGGFGVVYVAEQTKPVRRKVALKIIKPGMDSKEVIARFEAERQALAMMDHVNIAKVFDAGTTKLGRPYFVMELVHGTPITSYCDDAKLSPQERLELFIPVCQAIHHAHQKGIIHRDIKPSNVLVTMYDDKPVPKVIDFGIAKAMEQRLTEKSIYTQYGAMVGTFEYVSPEQAEMNAFGVDTRSDVYSLGVLLYELLTGTTPLDRAFLREAAYGEIIRCIKEEEPPRPSLRISKSDTSVKVASARRTQPAKLSSQVQGELDWIVMRCLEKDRTRRYDGPNDLAKDVESYLSDEPIDARPPGYGYLIKKAIRRHRVPLGMAAIILVAMVSTTLISLLKANQAARARLEAEEARRSAQAALNDVEKEKVRALEAEQHAKNHAAASQQNLYAADMKTAQVYIDAGQIGAANSLLNIHRPSLTPGQEPFEWRYLHRRAQGEVQVPDEETLSWRNLHDNGQTVVKRTLKGHSAPIDQVVFSPDGRFLASRAGKKEFFLWDCKNGFRCHKLDYTATNWLGGFGFSFDSKILGFVDAKNRLRLLETATLTTTMDEVAEILGPKVHGNPVFCPGSKRLLATAENKLHLIDYETGEWQPLFDGKRCGAFGFSAEGKRIWAEIDLKPNDPKHQDAKLVVWDIATQEFVGDAIELKGKPVGDLIFDQRIQAIVLDGGTSRITRPKSVPRRLVGPLQESNYVLLPERNLIIGCSHDYFLYAWEWQSGTPLARLSGHRDEPWTIDVASTGMIASGGRGQNILIWNLDAWAEREVARFEFDIMNHVAAESHDWVAGRNQEDDTLILDLESDSIIFTIPAGGSPIRFEQQDERLITVQDGQIVTWNLSSQTVHGEPISIGFLENDSRIEWGYWSDFHAVGGDLLAVGNRLSAGEKPMLSLLNYRTGEHLIDLEQKQTKTAISPDGETWAVLVDRQEGPIHLWNVPNKRRFASIDTEFRGAINDLAISPDGKLVAASSFDTTTKVWSAESGKLIYELRGQKMGVFGCAFSPDSKTLATIGHLSTLHLWNMDTGREVTKIKGLPVISPRIVFTSDGSHMLLSGKEATNKFTGEVPRHVILRADGWGG